jgi:hypothetical protein
MFRLPTAAQQSCGTAHDYCGMPSDFVYAPTRKPSPYAGASSAFRLETVGNEGETNSADKSMACDGRRKPRKAFGSIAASFLSAPAPYGCGKVSGFGKVTYPWPSFLRRSAREDRQRRANASRDLGCLTIPFGWSRQHNAARPPLAFRHASTLPLWVSNFPHCAARAFVGPRPDVPGCVAQRWTKLPLIGAVQHPQAAALMETAAVAWTLFAERGARCFSSFQRARPRGDAPTVPCGQALQVAARRRDPRRRLDLIPRNQRAADRRPRSPHAPTLTAQRKVQCH